MTATLRLLMATLLVCLAGCQGPLGVKTQLGYMGHEVLQRNVGATSLRLTVKQKADYRTQYVRVLDWERAEATLTNTDAALAPPTQTASATVDAENVRTASFFFSPLKPVAGYSLAIRLWKKNPAGTDEILAQGTAGPFTLNTGANAQTVPLALTAQGQLQIGTLQPTLPHAQLTALSQAQAKGLGTLLLEGSFAPGSATVNFPGGVSAAGTVLGANRLSVTVPAGATAGDLTVTSGTITSNPLSFRAPAFVTGIQTFQGYDHQADQARMMPALDAVRAECASVVIGKRLYLIGGLSGSDTASISVAPIHADGTLGQFVPAATSGGTPVVLNTARSEHTAAVVGNKLYVLGGDTSGGPLASVEVATIQPDDTLSTFSFATARSGGALTLATARQEHASAIAGKHLYVLGGYDETPANAMASVERAEIYPDGSLGAFAPATTALGAAVTLGTARYMHRAAVIGSKLYVFGGQDATSTNMASVEAAPIDPDGSLGAFAPATTSGGTPITLAAARARFGMTIVGDTLLVAGGQGGNTTLQQATIQPDGTLGTFTLHPTTSLRLQTGRSAFDLVPLGNRLYALGGQTGGGTTASVEAASFGANGALGSFATYVGIQLNTAREFHTATVVGSWLYVVGGQGASGDLGSVERAKILPDGSLDPSFGTSGFEATALSLGLPRRYHATAVIGKYLYVIGGQNASTLTRTVERARILADGSLDPAFGTNGFESLGNVLNTARDNHAALVLGDKLYVMGGSNGSPLNTIESFPVTNADGDLGAYADPGVGLGRAVYGASGVVAGGYAYLVGGNDGGVRDYVQRAPFAASGLTSGFVEDSNWRLTNARYEQSLAVLGNYLYVIGGRGLNSTTNMRARFLETGALDTGFGTNCFQDSGSLAATRYKHASVVVGDWLYLIGGNLGGSRSATVERAKLQ